MRMMITPMAAERMTVRRADKSTWGVGLGCVPSSLPRLTVGNAKMGPLAVGRGVRVGRGVLVARRGVTMNRSVVGVDEGINKAVKVAVGEGVREGLKKNGVREAVG